MHTIQIDNNMVFSYCLADVVRVIAILYLDCYVIIAMWQCISK